MEGCGFQHTCSSTSQIGICTIGLNIFSCTRIDRLPVENSATPLHWIRISKIWPGSTTLRKSYQPLACPQISLVPPLLGSNDRLPAELDYALVSSLERDPLLGERLERLRTIPGVGPITALTWALEIGDVSRFQSIKQAISYCGLCSAERNSADKPNSNA